MKRIFDLVVWQQKMLQNENDTWRDWKSFVHKVENIISSLSNWWCYFWIMASNNIDLERGRKKCKKNKTRKKMTENRRKILMYNCGKVEVLC